MPTRWRSSCAAGCWSTTPARDRCCGFCPRRYGGPTPAPMSRDTGCCAAGSTSVRPTSASLSGSAGCSTSRSSRPGCPIRLAGVTAAPDARTASSVMSAPLADVDPDIAELLGKELSRQRDTLEMIASENFVPRAVLQAQGSVLTNKYAEGLPGRRYYGGCEYVDVVENIARDRAKALFGADFANVQPHSGAQANAAVLHALMSPGERLLGLDLANGGHLTHGMKLNFSGKLYENGFYGVDPTTHLIDMDAVRAQAREFRPKVIVAGWSAYPRTLDFEAFRSIADEVDAKLWVDMAHFAGLVAVGLHPSPVPYADVVSTTIHKTLGGGRSG